MKLLQVLLQQESAGKPQWLKARLNQTIHMFLQIMFYQDITIYLHIIYSHWNNGKNESLRQCLIHKSENSYNFTLYRKVLLTSAIKQQKLISHLNRVPKCLKASLGQLCSIGYLGVMPPNQYALLHLSRWKKNREGCPSAIKCFCPSVTHWASHWPKQVMRQCLTPRARGKSSLVISPVATHILSIPSPEAIHLCIFPFVIST